MSVNPEAHAQVVIEALSGCPPVAGQPQKYEESKTLNFVREEVE